MTRVFGVIGHPIEHSLSPLMHAAAFEALGLDAVYSRFDVPAAVFSLTLQGLERSGIDGLNVTIPHKQRALAYARRRGRVSPEAAAVGAVNTLAWDQSGLVGYNTDVAGFLRLMRELRVSCRGKRVMLLGAGGAARAVGWALLGLHPAAIWVANRTRRKAEELARWLCRLRVERSRVGARRRSMGCAALPTDRHAMRQAARDAQILINATSLGLHRDDPLPIDPAALHPGLAVIDLVYARPTTRLAAAARRRGLLATDGLAMLVYQGAESFRLWWHRQPPLEAMRRAVEDATSAPSGLSLGPLHSILTEH
ncbi:MAG: shikimate dehydrogenase [Candidatus Omnitrophica bacterium]|nr:shikimate dehydrogenase [Candidatus Omnitrophota bacterium]